MSRRLEPLLLQSPASSPAARDPRPIGVFDSGVGGLTVVSALRRQLPGESILYLGDTARLPYGTKSPETVTRYSRRNINFLVERDVKAVVIACNTASAVTMEHDELERARSQELSAPVPVWGVIEPGAAAAVAQARAKAGQLPKIGVLATESTIQSQAYGLAIRRLEPKAEVVAQACPLFVPLVEDDWCDDPVAELVARRYLQPVLDAGVGTLVLGCTHYPLLEEVIQRVAGPGVACVDSARTVALKVSSELDRLGLRSPADAPVELHFCVTDKSDRFQRIAERLLQLPSDGTTAEEVVAGRQPEALSLEWVDV